MSADSWAVCPQCVTGGTHAPGDRPTFREDWELGLNDESWGEDEVDKAPCIIVNYRGACSVCGLTVEVHERYPIVLTPVKNEPDTARAETGSWEQIPATWFVQAPKSGVWHEVLATRAMHSGLQLVELKGPDGAMYETRRPADQRVTCCPGTLSPSAFGTLFGAFPNATIIEDQAG